MVEQGRFPAGGVSERDEALVSVIERRAAGLRRRDSSVRDELREHAVERGILDRQELLQFRSAERAPAIDHDPREWFVRAVAVSAERLPEVFFRCDTIHGRVGPAGAVDEAGLYEVVQDATNSGLIVSTEPRKDLGAR